MLVIIRTNSDNEDFQELVGLLDEDLAIRDGAEHSFYAQFNKIDAIRNAVVAYSDGKAVGCGAFKKYADDTVEIKRMFVRPQNRGKGIAIEILKELEKWAHQEAFNSAVLETGKKQPEAIRLYQKSGYETIPNYGQYAGIENSVCMKKMLVLDSQKANSFMAENTLTKKQDSNLVRQTEFPTAEELSVLNTAEKFGFRLTHRMNQGAWKRLMTFCQRHIGSLWIKISTYNLMEIYGIENFEKTAVNRPIILVANHRSFFDMYVVSTALFRNTKRDFQLYFPVRAKFFYSSPIGWLVNLVMGWFSMYPPFFRERGESKKREFDKFSMRKLVRLCSEGKPNIVGFHPEGERNLSDDQHELLPAQPGVGAVIIKAQPQVVPVFVAGLGNDLPKQIMGNWRGGEKIRVRFGSPVDLSEFYEKKDRLRTHKEISDFLMTKISELAEEDKKNVAVTKKLSQK